MKHAPNRKPRNKAKPADKQAPEGVRRWLVYYQIHFLRQDLTIRALKCRDIVSTTHDPVDAHGGGVHFQIKDFVRDQKESMDNAIRFEIWGANELSENKYQRMIAAEEKRKPTVTGEGDERKQPLAKIISATGFEFCKKCARFKYHPDMLGDGVFCECDKPIRYAGAMAHAPHCAAKNGGPICDCGYAAGRGEASAQDGQARVEAAEREQDAHCAAIAENRAEAELRLPPRADSPKPDFDCIDIKQCAACGRDHLQIKTFPVIPRVERNGLILDRWALCRITEIRVYIGEKKETYISKEPANTSSSFCAGGAS